MSSGFVDLMYMVKNPGLILFMAWSDVSARYKRSILGPFWITVSTAIGVVGLGFIWSELFHLERKVYIPMLSVGLILWQFFSSSLSEATTTFTRQANLVKNLDLPISFHPAQLLLRQLINLAHTLPLFFVVALIVGLPLTATCWLALPALMIVILNVFWMMLLLGLLGARYRDLEYLVAMVMPLLMFFSPVMYKSSSLPFPKWVMSLNPLGQMIEIVRSPLLGEVPSMWVIMSNLVVLVLGGGFTLWLFNKKRDRVALWV